MDFKTIEGFSRYLFTDIGTVYSLHRNAEMRPYKNKKGYLILSLHNDCGAIKCIPVHRLIWMAFNGEVPSHLKVDHIDNNPGNNHINNLQLLTNRENVVKGKSRKPKASPYTGVRLVQRKNGQIVYRAQIKHKNRLRHLGVFEMEEDAADAYKEALKKILSE